MDDLEIAPKRKLASIQEISSLTPLGKKPVEELAIVLGWKVIVPIRQFKEGEKIIFFEIDSLLPAQKNWTNHIKHKNLKIKTIEKYNQISQGFIMKLDTLLKIEYFKDTNIYELPIGFNLTEILGIKKYDDDAEQLEIGNKKLKNYPKHLIEKSDEIRLQSRLNYLEEFRGKEFYSSLKYDGTSVTYLIEPETNNFLICSRNQVQTEDSVNIYSKIAEKYEILKKLKKFDGKFAIQGEIYGPKIQNNPLQVKELMFVVFNIKNIRDDYYLGFDELVKTCKDLGLPMVKVVEEGIFNYNSVEKLIEKSKGYYPGTNNFREGLVYRLKNDWNKNKRYSFKVINDDYLINKK